jgi:triosephosphate isomerase
MAPEKISDAVSLGRKALSLSKKYKKEVSVVVCPSFPALSSIRKISKSIVLGAQTVAALSDVAQTGLVGAGQLKSLGVAYAIVGHSEARARGDGNDLISQQIARLLEKKIIPILCVGEQERDSQGWYLSEVKEQLETALAGVSRSAIKQLVIAYEPVWAIGSKAVREATPVECREMVIYIRKIIADLFDVKTGDAVRVLYGGSVDEKNAKQFITEGGANGLLVGRVSLDAVRFAALARSLAAR